ncbi:hypothetical protein BVY01_00765 [bacterium I07]|nr:hypothetical protein BVY01_00765 [bacterium I07]
MDVWKPENPNGLGIIIIQGSGWYRDLDYDATQLKSPRNGMPKLFEAFTDAGYTLFSINHRAATRFRYPAAVEDAKRAVRFVRYNAKKFGIDSDKIGVFGGSSGGHLALLLGTLDDIKISDVIQTIETTSSKVQCIVAWYPPTNLNKMNTPKVIGTLVSFMGFETENDTSSYQYKTFVEASPISHVTADDPPVLFVHGDADDIVPFEQSESMCNVLKKNGIDTKLITIHGGTHSRTFEGAINPPDFISETIDWFNQHLRE